MPKTYVLMTYDGVLPDGLDAKDLRDFIVSMSAAAIGGFHPADPASSLRRNAFSGKVIKGSSDCLKATGYTPPTREELKKRNFAFNYGSSKGGELDVENLMARFKELLETVLLDSRYHHATGGAEHSGRPSGQRNEKTVESQPEIAEPRTLHPAGHGPSQTKNVPDED